MILAELDLSQDLKAYPDLLGTFLAFAPGYHCPRNGRRRHRVHITGRHLAFLLLEVVCQLIQVHH
jgi:hypothetical protein